MATFVPFPGRKLKDGTSRVRIKLHHNGKRKLIRTEILLTDADLTKSRKIRSLGIREEVEDIIRNYRLTLQRIGAARVSAMSIEEVYDALMSREAQGDAPDFFQYMESVISQLKADGKTGNAANYTSALNSIREYHQAPTLPFNNLNSRFIRDYSNYLRVADSRRHKNRQVKVGSRAVSLYMSTLRAVINRARAEFNDEDTGDIIRVNPFAKFKIPQESRSPPRAISIGKIRAIRDLKIPHDSKRAILARDCFMLSFYLIGMNSADLYEVSPNVNNRIDYERKKTRSRRADKALLSVKVEPEAVEILKKYNFKKLYASAQTFNKAINLGLKEVGKLIGIPELTFYAARHSWATIAANDCGIDKYTVHLALNHVVDEMKITDIYIMKDWSVIDRANRMVLDFVNLS